MKKKPFTHLGGTSGRVKPRGGAAPTGPKLNLRQAPVRVAKPAAAAPNVGDYGAGSTKVTQEDAIRDMQQRRWRAQFGQR